MSVDGERPDAVDDGPAEDERLLSVFRDPARAGRDREEAFHRLVRRHSHRVYAVCFRQLGDASDAEDAVQEVFLRLARNADRFRGDAALSTWLYRVAHNVCTDLVRRSARRPQTPVADVLAVADVPADDETAGRAAAIDVSRALAELDPESRTLLLLVSVDGCSYEEAAAAVGVPVGTAKSRVSRARARLGELLAAPPGRQPTSTR